jgi:hypothetical protein
LPQLDCHVSLNTFELAALKQVLRTYHHAFCEGKASLPIINGPTDLVAYTCALFFETHPLDNQLKLALTTDLPIGCGMGSSAAVVVSTLKALNALHDDALNTDELCVLAKAAEDLQHGLLFLNTARLRPYLNCLLTFKYIIPEHPPAPQANAWRIRKKCLPSIRNSLPNSLW